MTAITVPATVSFDLPATSGGLFVLPEDYGWTPTSTPTESTTAVQAAINAAAVAGKRVWLSAKYPINAQIVLPSNTVIASRDARQCGFLQVTGVTLDPMVLAQDVVPPKFHRVGFFGVNYKGAANYTPGAFELRMTSAYAADMPGFEMLDCYQENFATDIWNRLRVVDNPTFDIVAPQVRGNTYISMLGNDQGYDSLGRQSTMWNVTGYKDAPTPPAAGTTLRGVVRDGVFEDLYADGTHLKSYIFLWGATRNCAVRSATLYNFGATALSDKGAYAVASYGDRTPTLPEPVGRYDPSGHRYENLRIINPYSCGIYFAQVDNPSVRGCVISGQYDTGNTTLPKAGIAVNGATGVALVENNKLLDCFTGIAVTDVKEGSDVVVRGNVVESATANAIGVLFSGANSMAYNFIARVAGNIVKLTGGSSIGFKTSNTNVNLGDLCVSDNFLSAKLSALSITRVTSMAWRRVKLNDNHFEGNTAGTMVLIDPTLSLLELGANEYDLRYAASHGLGVAGCTRVLISGVQQLHDKPNVTGTYAFSADGAQGQIQVPLSFDGALGSGQRNSASALGSAKPTWTAEPGSVVCALAPIVTGSSIVDRWVRASNGTWYGVQGTAI